MRKGDVIAAVVITLLVLPLALSWYNRWSAQYEYEEPRPEPIAPVLDSAMHAVTAAESISYARYRRFPDDARELRALVTLPTAVRLLQVDGTESTWTVRLDGALGGEWRRCTLGGGIRRGEPAAGTTVAFCDSKPRR